MTKGIPLTQGYVTLVDDADFEWLSKYKWCAHKVHSSVYAVSSGYPQLSMHRLITQAPRDKEVDHINGDGLDNQRCNLRIVTRQQNLCNRFKKIGLGTSQYKGVWFNSKLKAKPWIAVIKVKNERMFLGTFATEEEAARAYDAASLKYHGEFGRRNLYDYSN